MKDVILLLFGFVSGVLVTFAFGRKVTSAFANALTKTAAKVEPKN